MAGQAYGDMPSWLDNVSISPPNPTSQNVVSITVSGEWGDSCIPNASFVWVVGNDIYFEVFRNYPPGIQCAFVISGWEQTQYVGPLSPGVYTLSVHLNDGMAPGTYITQFTVGPPEHHVPSEYSTIQAAINASSNGDVVIVAPGTYYENINMKNGVIVKGAGADVTTIDGGENGHVVVFNSASGTISGFTITNSGTDPISRSGIYISQSTVNINNNIIGNNRYGIRLLSNSNCIITGNKVINNSAEGIQVSDSNGTISNNVIAGNSRDGIRCFDSSPSIINNTITGNGGAGVTCDPTSPQVIANNIITHNETGVLAHCANDPPSPLLHISYNNVWDNSYANYWEDYGSYDGGEYVSQPFTPLPGTGEIHQSPLFADSNSGDYHLKSTAGRWNPNTETWVMDANTSVCIDAGNPGCPLGDEPNGINNVRINMGAYGGTAQASKTPVNWYSLADLTNDWQIDLSDVKVFTSYWLMTGNCLPGDLNRNQTVDFRDFAVFAEKYDESHLAEPNIIYNISDCIGGLSQIDQMDQTRFTVTVEGKHIHFEDMMVANCCTPLSNLWLEMTVNGNLITIYEREELPLYPCFCICDYPVDANSGPFETGTYTLDVYEDYGGFIGSTTFTIE
jgi:parallel beta-helix repeat protein